MTAKALFFDTETTGLTLRSFGRLNDTRTYVRDVR